MNVGLRRGDIVREVNGREDRQRPRPGGRAPAPRRAWQVTIERNGRGRPPLEGRRGPVEVVLSPLTGFARPCPWPISSKPPA